MSKFRVVVKIFVILFAFVLIIAIPSQDGCYRKQITGLVNPEIDTLYLKQLLTGRVNFGSDSNFVKVPGAYTNRYMYLEKNTFTAFVKMHNAAKAEGVDLKIVSGGRTFGYQRRIWERKWLQYEKTMPDSAKARDILRYSAMPSTSRHHWGTEVDINNLNNEYFDSGRGLREYQWLKDNAKRFGFWKVYTNKSINGRTGYEMERWHWSFLPVAIENTLNYARLITYEDLNGYSGSSESENLKVIEHYVFGVSCCSNQTLLFQ